MKARQAAVTLAGFQNEVFVSSFITCLHHVRPKEIAMLCDNLRKVIAVF